MLHYVWIIMCNFGICQTYSLIEAGMYSDLFICRCLYCMSLALFAVMLSRSMCLYLSTASCTSPGWEMAGWADIN